MLGRAPIACVLAIACLASLVSSGCARKSAVVEATPSAQTATETATEAPTEAAVSPAPGASESPQAENATPTPEVSGPPNLLSFAQGTITREWPPTDADTAANTLLLAGYKWKSKAGATGPFVFVFELAAPAEIDSFVISAYEQNGEFTNAAQSVRVEGSTQGADAGYSSMGDYTLKDTPGDQSFPLSRPVTARWLRVTIQQRAPDFTELAGIQALGKLPPSQAKSLAGVWLEDTSLMDAHDKLFSGEKLATAPDPTLANKDYELVQIVEQNGVLRAGRCHPYDGTDVGPTWGGTQVGATVKWEDLVSQGTPAESSVVNAEGTMMIGGSDMLVRLAPGPTCTKVEPPVGSGQNVLVLDPDGRLGIDWYPGEFPKDFPGFRFTPLAVALLTQDWLTGADTVVLACVDKAAQRVAHWQAQALNDFVSAGHKLIIYDADKCGTETDYSFLPYPFKTSNPGANGASSKNLFLVESDTLGSDKKDPQHFLDVAGYVAESNQQIGDANTVTTHDPHWCGHLYGTNVMKVNGFMHMYAPYGRGLIIYNGFDEDESSLPEHMRLQLLELQQPVPAPLPCTASAAGKFVVAPSAQAPFLPGRAASVKFPLQVLANLGYVGTVSLTTKAPAEAPWATKLSTSQVTLKGDTAPVDLSIDVPANATAGSYQFTVLGDDGSGNTASALITLVGNPPPKVVQVKPVTKGCTERLTIGADALFAFGEATLTPVAQKTLAGLGPTIKNAGKHPVRINGFTDSIGSDAYNQALSEQRARSVRDWLAAHGYVKSSTAIQGFGKLHPVAPNTKPDGSDDPQGRAKNRRVEVLIDTCK
jgi:outer membrane protein OmpA-like peptidoglycan-associated protein